MVCKRQICIFCSVLLCHVFRFCKARLVMVQSLSRHGPRAPNVAVVDLCPAVFPSQSQILLSFGVAPALLTRKGMHMLAEVGAFLREEYVDKLGFLSGNFFKDAALTSFSAVDYERHLASIASIGQGLYPSIAVPVSSQPLNIDNRLKSPPAFCAPECHKHIVDWIDTHMVDMLTKNASVKNVVDILGQVCGRSIDPLGASGKNDITEGNPHPEVQDVKDAFSFMKEQRLELPSQLTPAIFEQANDVVFRAMMERMFYDLPTMVRYCGTYPSRVEENMMAALSHARNGDAQAQPVPIFFLDVASRELLYALAAYYGFKFNIPGEPEGYMHIGTNLIWELHVPDSPDDQNEEAFVSASFFYPQTSGGTSGRQALRMGDCPVLCPLSKFLDIHKRWHDKVGDFEQLCPSKEAGDLAKKFEKEHQKMVTKDEKLAKKERSDLVIEAHAYALLSNCSSPASRWDSNERVVRTFCRACSGFSSECETEAAAGYGAFLVSSQKEQLPITHATAWIAIFALGVIVGSASVSGLWLFMLRREAHSAAGSNYRLLG